MDMFLWSGYASFAAFVLTFWFIPDVTNLDLYEIDTQWRLTAQGRRKDYSGPAAQPEFLSYHERTQLGLHY
jgi:hypothetical protein